MGTITQPVVNSQSLSYPHEIEVTLNLKIRVTNPEERDYYLTPEGNLTPGVIADVISDYMGYGNETLLSVNDKTTLDAQAALNGDGAW